MGPEEQGDTEVFDLSKVMEAPPEVILRDFIEKLGNKIVSKRDKDLLIIYYPESEHGGMLPRDVSIVYSILRGKEREKPLDVLLHSRGGDIHTAYKLAKLFHRYSNNVNIIIPEYAKSAATLVAIAAHSIEMCPIAELGPLDPLINFGSGFMPAFAVRNAIKILEKEIESCKDKDVRKLKAENIIGPIAVKIDPYLLSAVADTPEVAKRYGNKLLVSIGYEKQIADRILKSLVEMGHPSHGYVIDFEEAKDIGLNAEEMEDDDAETCGLLLLFLRQYEAANIRDNSPLNQPYVNLFSSQEQDPENE